MHIRLLIAAFLTLLFGANLPYSAMAQSNGAWTGTWETNYGELKLVENGLFVYGDYADDRTIEGQLSSDGHVLRAIFRYPNGTSGYVEFVQSGDDGNRISGRWIWAEKAGARFPKWDDASVGSRWRGTRRSAARPTTSNSPYRPTMSQMFARAPSGSRAWLSWQRPSDARAAGTETASRVVATVGQSERIPRYVDVTVFRISTTDAGAVWGLAGAYLSCKSDSGSRMIPLFGGAPNRIFDVPASGKSKTHEISGRSATRRFVLDQNCFGRIDGKTQFQIQSNLWFQKDRHVVGGLFRPAMPVVDFGYQGRQLYLEDLPEGREDIEGFALQKTGAGKWDWKMTVDRFDHKAAIYGRIEYIYE